MTNQEKIRWLKRYTTFGRRLHNQLEKCEELRSELGKITPTLSLIPGGGGSIHKSHDHDTINKLVDIITLMEAQMNAWTDARVEIESAINAVGDDRYEELLTYRYLDGRTFEWIAAEMNYHWVWIHKLHSRALDKIVIT
jgi:hypothetical protein